VSRMYHDCGIVGCRRYLWCQCHSGSGQQMAHCAALVFRFLTPAAPRETSQACELRRSSFVVAVRQTSRR
jgi:hypothetical protein